jgi:tripartite-type tricarboxylate transporter receptor subunit TctC
MCKRFVVALIAIVALASAANADARSEYPNRPITIVVPYPAGGTADILARKIGEKLRGYLGQPVIVENRTGAGGNIGTEFVARSAPDGYTVVLASQFVYSVFDLLYERLSYQPRSLTPVSVLATYPTALLGSPNIPANSLSELIEYARRNPGKLNYGSQGNGQIGHLTVEMLKQLADIRIMHIPYRGSAPAVNDLLAGQVDVLAELLLATMPLIQQKKVKIFALTGEKRMGILPDVPAAREIVPGFVAEAWLAIAAPAGTPPEITQKLSETIAKAIHAPDVQNWIRSVEAEPLGSTPERMTQLIQLSRERWLPVINSASIRAE